MTTLKRIGAGTRELGGQTNLYASACKGVVGCRCESPGKQLRFGEWLVQAGTRVCFEHGLSVSLIIERSNEHDRCDGVGFRDASLNLDPAYRGHAHVENDAV